MFLPMAKIVLDMITACGQDIVPLIFMFPSGSSSVSNFFDQMLVQAQTGHKAVLIKAFAAQFMGNGQFTPVHPQAIITSAQRQIIEIPIPPDFPMTAVPVATTDFWQLASPLNGGDCCLHETLMSG